MTNFHIEENLEIVKNNWVRAIEIYCQEQGIEPMEFNSMPQRKQGEIEP